MAQVVRKFVGRIIGEDKQTKKEDKQIKEPTPFEKLEKNEQNNLVYFKLVEADPLGRHDKTTIGLMLRLTDAFKNTTIKPNNPLMLQKLNSYVEDLGQRGNTEATTRIGTVAKVCAESNTWEEAMEKIKFKGMRID